MLCEFVCVFFPRSLARLTPQSYASPWCIFSSSFLLWCRSCCLRNPERRRRKKRKLHASNHQVMCFVVMAELNRTNTNARFFLSLFILLLSFSFMFCRFSASFCPGQTLPIWNSFMWKIHRVWYTCNACIRSSLFISSHMRFETSCCSVL